MVKNTPYPLATKRFNDDASTNRCLPLHGALWMQPWEWSPIQCCYRTIMRAPWTYLLSSYAAIDGDQPIEQIFLYLPRYGCFPCLPRHAHDERVFFLQSDFHARITKRFDTIQYERTGSDKLCKYCARGYDMDDRNHCNDNNQTIQQEERSSSHNIS